MASTSFYLDSRKLKKDGTCPLRINISKDSKTCSINLNVHLRPDQWDAKANKVIGRSDRTYLNTVIYNQKHEIDNILMELMYAGKVRNSTAKQLREMIVSELDPGLKEKKMDALSFSSIFLKYVDRHKGRTKEIYEATYNHLQKFLGDKLKKLRFEDISKDWLEDFDDYLSKTSPSKNARNIHLRNIRAVFNYAIDNEITTHYPFRRFSIKNVETIKRSLSVEELRKLFSYPCEDWQRQYVDIFKLIFMLCGINIIDLYNLKEIVHGRVDYYRAKTHKLYSIKVEPEALEIINNYKGKHNLLNLADRCKNYRSYSMRLNDSIQRIKGFETVTTYWMRHTWASIAAELDIPDDTISRALGHSQTSGARVTQVYINFNHRKIDEANRKVIDYVLYDKR